MPRTSKTKKSKTKRKTKQNKHAFWVSCEKRCDLAAVYNPATGGYLYEPVGGCQLPISEETYVSYVIVYNQKHLEEKKYKCGCVTYKNKYYSEFNIPELEWNDFFGIKLDHGKKFAKFSIVPF